MKQHQPVGGYSVEHVDSGASGGEGRELTIASENLSDLTADQNAAMPIGDLCRRDHPLVAAGGALHWSSLQAYPLVRNGTSRLLEGTEAAGLLESSLLFVSNMISLIAMLEEGIGITTLPYLAFPAGNEQLAFLPLSEPKVERQIGILSRKGRSLSPAAAALMGFLHENMQMSDDSDASVKISGASLA